MKNHNVFLLFLLCVFSCHGAIITVDDSGGADYTNIQDAIDAASDWDTIVVADGVYTGERNQNIGLLGKRIVVESENGPENCIIDCEYAGDPFDYISGFWIHGGEDANSIVDGFTVTRSLYYGIICSGNGPIIRNCIISGNFYDGMLLASSSATVVNCVVTGNYGRGIECHDSTSLIVNCTVAGNESQSYGGGISVTNGSNATVVNCIFSGNWAHLHGNQIAIAAGTEYRSFLDMSHSSVEGGQEEVYVGPGSILTWGDGNIDVDPLFARPGHWEQDWIFGDYHLKSQAGRWDPNTESWQIDIVTSLCIDGGDPSYDVGDEPENNGDRINMGAYGGTVEASKSMSPAVGCADEPEMDFNKDCKVDSSDFAMFAKDWLECNLEPESNCW